MQNRHCPLCHHADSHLKYKVQSFHIVTCRQCGFVYLANPVDKDKEAEQYDDYFRSADLGDYSKESSDANLGRAWHLNEQRIGWIRQHLEKGTLLDIGCGRGFFLQHAQQNGFQVEGVEISRLAAQYASEHFDLTVHVSSLEQPINFGGDFDVITMWHVLEHFQQPRAAMENVWSLLKPGGTVFIEVPNLNSLKFKLSPTQYKWRGGNHPVYHRSFFTHKSLIHLLELCGFSDIRIEHLSYQTENNKLLHAPKKLLNLVHLDSFLAISGRKAK